MLNPSLVDSASDLIKQDIVCGALPPGSQVKVQDLSSDYGFGATPIREALSRLCAVSMLSYKPNCGFKVPDFDSQHLNDLFSLRQILEPVAIKDSFKSLAADFEETAVVLRHRLSKTQTILEQVFAQRNLYLHLFSGLRSRIMRMAIESAYDCCLFYYYLFSEHNESQSADMFTLHFDKLESSTASQCAAHIRSWLAEDRGILGHYE
jgi:DNA-binding GntR family transcriptional regulator